MKNNTDPFIWNEVIHKMFTENLKMFMKSDKGISRLLDEIDNSVTSDELLLNGELIDDSGDYEQYYADAPGGEYHRIRIVKYDGKFYVYKEKVTIDRDCNEKAECVAFYELR